LARLFILGALCSVLASCNFDNMFLFPEKIPSTTERLNIVNHQSGQNLVVEIGEQFQPTLKTEDGDLFDPGYEIESRVFKNEIGNQE